MTLSVIVLIIKILFIMLNKVFSFITTTAPDSTSVSTPKSFDFSNISTLSINELMDKLISDIVTLAINIAIATFVFYIGKFIIKKIVKFVLNLFIRRDLDRSLGLFIISVVKIVLYFILIVTIIGILGIETSSFLALFASAGVAIGMALSGTLQNFAGGVLILLLKPYKIGDFIEVPGYSGTVKEIQIFHTVINTFDNKTIIIPNGGLSTGSINNWSREDYRRVDWTISISYGDDVDKAREVISNLFAKDERIVTKYIEEDRKKYQTETALDNEQIALEEKRRPWWKRIFCHHNKLKKAIEELDKETKAKAMAIAPKVDRSPVIYINKLNNSSVDLVARVWTRSEFYWSVYFDINEQIYKELPKHGISFPFPQVHIHLDKQNQ